MKRSIFAGVLGSITVVAGTTLALEPTQATPFNPPTENSAPSQATGGASRSGVGFNPPAENAAPSAATGGASRSVFAPPDSNAAPNAATGGASRSVFAPPDSNAAPNAATGGASRSVFLPTGNSAPNESTGGASRSVFLPTGNSAPNESTGGASREFVPPVHNSAPQQAEGGASRNVFVPAANHGVPQEGVVGGAARANDYGTYLAPDSAPVSMLALTPPSFYGTTLSERPAFLAYLPHSGVQEAIFSLKDEAENLVYQMTIPVTGSPEVMVIQLPETAPALEVGQNYQWYVALPRDGVVNPSVPFVDAWVKRIEPTPEQREALQSGQSLELVSTLAEQGIWYDSVSTLANLRIEQPASDVLEADWEELMESVDLSDFADIPFTPVN